MKDFLKKTIARLQAEIADLNKRADASKSVEETTIGDSAFWSCNSLTSLTIPDSVTTIGDSAFAWCKSLTSVTIGKSVSEIGRAAFNGCNIDTIVCCPKIPPKIDDSFDKFENLIVPTGCEEAYANSDWGKYLE